MEWIHVQKGLFPSGLFMYVTCVCHLSPCWSCLHLGERWCTVWTRVFAVSQKFDMSLEIMSLEPSRLNMDGCLLHLKLNVQTLVKGDLWVACCKCQKWRWSCSFNAPVFIIEGSVRLHYTITDTTPSLLPQAYRALKHLTVLSGNTPSS